MLLCYCKDKHGITGVIILILDEMKSQGIVVWFQYLQVEELCKIK